MNNPATTDRALIDSLMESHIAEYPDFPKPGILFRDITPLLRDGEAFRSVIRYWASIIPQDVEVIVGTEARGFMLGAPLAHEIGAGFVPARKAGKLPGTPHRETYDLEYGTASLEIQEGAIVAGTRTLVVDDLLATGGTAVATCDLVKACGGDLLGVSFLIELQGLGGKEKLGDLPFSAVCSIPN
ncbi:adenine phosphoribosyltransferase [Dermabacteraceae bacterium P7074]